MDGRGKGHTIASDDRAVYARTSTDGGKAWTAETVVADAKDYGEVAVGKGIDATGAMLLWVRRIGKNEWHHDLCRSTDGVTFTLIATPTLALRPMQITGVFSVPKVGLMALGFGGDYSDKPTQSWGVMTSRDDGKTWTQTPIESGLLKPDWPTEPAAVYLGDGKILAIARTEPGPAQFQMISIHRQRSHMDPRSHQHQRCLRLHTEPHPQCQAGTAEQLLLRARSRHHPPTRRRSEPRV